MIATVRNTLAAAIVSKVRGAERSSDQRLDKDIEVNCHNCVVDIWKHKTRNCYRGPEKWKIGVAVRESSIFADVQMQRRRKKFERVRPDHWDRVRWTLPPGNVSILGLKSSSNFEAAWNSMSHVSADNTITCDAKVLKMPMSSRGEYTDLSVFYRRWQKRPSPMPVAHQQPMEDLHDCRSFNSTVDLA